MPHRHDTRPKGRTRRKPPRSPSGLGPFAWFGVLRRTVRGFVADGLPDWAAALTYYAILSLFPALLVLISLLGLAGQKTLTPLVDSLGGLAPGPTKQIIGNVLATLGASRNAAGIAAVGGTAVALWSASGYVAAFMRAANAVYDMPEGRPVWKTIPTRLAITAVLVILLAVSALALVVTGPLADRIGQLLGIGSTGVTLWTVAKWPGVLLVVMTIFAILYWAAPNVRPAGFRWITPGSVLALLCWLVVSVAFGLYVANFGSYNKVYGALAGVVIFLIWLWLSNIAVLLGIELNAELSRARAIAAGQEPEEEPYAEPRDTRKFPDEFRGVAHRDRPPG